MTITTSRRGVVEIVEDIAKADEGTADLVVSMLAYDALCDEVDRIGPQLDRDVSRLVVKRAEGALQAIAKRWHGATGLERAELEELAGTITAIALVAKGDDTTQATPDDPKTPWWDARNAEGEFVARGAGGSAMRRISGGLSMFTGQDKDTKRVVGEGFDRIASSNRYDVARALGRGLQRSGVPGTQSVGSLARMVGDIGPEAQRVFGRGLTRLAYRYRGTERRPDPLVADASRRLSAASGTNDQKRLETISRLGVDALWRDVPNQKLAELSLASGKMPPSQGIIFDAQGHAVSQSVGYNGDHYLPFDLKNLKRLRGGQYVRTRTTGGLTDEDIYTGLLTGARKVTVVSNSGVFSIEFDPQLRGGRRYSDKARQMVGRYAALVNTIDQGEKNNLLVSDLDSKEKAALRTKAFNDARGNKDLAETLYAEAKRKARFERKFTARTDEELNAIALEQAKVELRNKPSSSVTVAQRQRDLFHDMRREERSKAVRFYQLDGEGYSAAQDALAQEFPYFIRKKTYEPLDEWIRRTNKPVGPDDPIPPRPGKDIGYTRRGALSPDRAGGEIKPPKQEAAGGTKTIDVSAPADEAKSQAMSQQRAETRSQLTSDLADSLSRSLALRLDLETDAHGEPLQGASGETDAQAIGIPPDAWADWILTTKGGPEGAAKFLTNPDTDLQHIKKAKLALARYKPTAENDPALRSAFDGFDEAMQLLDQAALVNKPFEAPAEHMVLANPDVSRPAPQPFPEITDLDLSGLVAYARDNPELATEAQAALDENGEKTLIGKIKAGVAHVNGLLKWPKANGEPKPDHDPADKSLTYADAMLAAQPGGLASLPVYQELEAQQKAWTLARAVKVSAVHEQAEVPTLAPKETQGKRAPLPGLSPRLQVRKSGSQPLRPGISKRFQTGHRRQSSSIPPLAVTLAKRLADDPRYLDRLWSGGK